MAIRYMSEKRVSTPSNSKAWSAKPGNIAIVACQHTLLWCSLYVTASAIYALAVGAVFTNNIPSIVLFIVAGVLSLAYISVQNIATHLRTKARDRWQSQRADTCQALAQHVLRILFTIWMVTCGLSITFTAARHPLCEMHLAKPSPNMAPLDFGPTCIVNRVGIIVSCVGLIACGALFVLVHKVNDSSRAHLFGIVREQDLMPLFLPYRNTADKRLCSDMSFKCRSSTSLSSSTLPMPWSASTAFLVESQPRHSQGLGIYTGHRSTTSLLSARPSLSSIRSHSTFSMPPSPTSPLPPLPPLPAHIPNKYRETSAVHRDTIRKAVYPPRSTHGPKSILRPASSPASSPALSTNNLAILRRSNTSQQSLSSIYSRSISGEQNSPLPAGMAYSPNVGARYSSLPRRPSSLSMSSRSSSSTSTAILKRSPLGNMTIAEEPLSDGPLIIVDSAEVDEAVELQRRLRSERASIKAGLVKTSELEGYVDRHSGLSRFSYWPLNVNKTRQEFGHQYCRTLV